MTTKNESILPAVDKNGHHDAFCWSCRRMTKHEMKRNQGWDGSGGSEEQCVDPKHDHGADHE
jgi:hypothetical protein